MGFDAVDAYDVEQALDRIRTRSVDFVLSDVDMPRMSSPALRAALSSERPALAQRFAFFTGAPPLHLPHGVPVLIKPVDPDRLRQILPVPDRPESS